MRCHFFPGGVICTSRRSLPKCSTPGCRGRGELSCDAPVKRENPPAPKPGDTRLHLERRVVFYVWAVNGDEVAIGTTELPISGRGAKKPQRVSITDWFRKTEATCDRPVCRGCAGHDGRLDLCGAHARETTKQIPAAAGEEQTT